MRGGGKLTFSSNFRTIYSFYGFEVKVFGKFGGKESVSQFVSDKGVCRTAPARPGLLNIRT